MLVELLLEDGEVLQGSAKVSLPDLLAWIMKEKKKT